jgi:anaerobic selenocysteine-containing dehydrogenase
MEGEAEVVRKGQLGIIKMGLVKKLEGNPNHPVNRGKLCARGQAGLQVTYHPDRLRNPLKQTGKRGSGQFQEISWDDALKELASQLMALRSANQAASLAVLTNPLRGQRRELIERFVRAFGAPPPISYEPFDEAVLRQANLLSFGRAQLPTLDLARADYLISFGADFLGTWNSPVSQAIGYGEMRQGRAGRRGKFVQVEPRMSQTGANADEWVLCRPGTEGVLALGIAHVILKDLGEKSGKPKVSARASGSATSVIAGWAQGLPDYAPAEVEKRTGVSAATISRLAREIGRSGLAAAIIGGAPLAHTNGLFNAMAVHALEALVDTGDSGPAIVSFTPAPPFAPPGATPAGTSIQGSFSAIRALAQEILLGQAHAPKVLLVYEANPVFSVPAAVRVREALAKVPYLASFSSFLDETSALADLILPDHSPLESWLDDVSESGTTQATAGLAAPAVRPLHNTRPMPDIILDLARQLGGDVAAALPWKTFDAMLRSTFVPLSQRPGSLTAKSDDDFWKKVQNQGGWWSTASADTSDPPDPRRQPSRVKPLPHLATITRPPAAFAEPEFDGAEKDFPFNFLPYVSQAFRDGSLAHLPWLQELPDVLSTAMWSAWIEINPQTAVRLGIRQGDLVEVESQHGKVQAPALLYPGIAPNVIAMPAGQGHENFTRYASGRGANPVSILAPMVEGETNSLAWAATRVKISRLGEGKLTLFGGGLSRFPPENEHR